MKILLVHIYFTEKYGSGVNPIVFGTYEKLRKEGHEVYVFSLNETPYYDENYKYTEFFPSSHLLCRDDRTSFSEFIYYLNYIYNFEAKKKMEKLLDEVKPDIVHIHSTWELSFSIMQPIRKRKIPIVYTVHDIQIFCPAIFFVGTNYCTKCKGLNTLPCTTKKCIKGIGWRSAYFSFKAFVERILGSHKADLYLTVSKATKDYIKEFGISENKIKVLPNYIQEDFLSKAISSSDPNEANYFLYAGGSGHIKGIMTLLNALKELPREINVHLAGEYYNTEAETFIKENNLSNVKIIGKLTQDEMQKEYQNCISAIMPSELFETFGMINIEAAAHKKPSIGANIGGIPEIIEHNITGLLFEPKNINQLKECILKYWNTPDLAKEHGKNAFKKVVDKYTDKTYYTKLSNIYEQLLK